MRHELAASRGAWPAIAAGLPSVLPPTLRGAVGVASTAAKALREPTFIANASKLTGPAAGIAGIYESYERLTKRGWRLTEASIDAILSGPPSGASFERQNSPLYLDAIYDAHFNLSLLGKSLSSGYEQLGGPAAFGAAFTRSELNALVSAYSVAAMRLSPHPSGAAKEG